MKSLLMILDGWGIGNNDKANAIYSTSTPHWDNILNTYPHSQLQASGENVGLPDGQMGNSEVGHLNIGAGRVVYQDLVKINNAIKDGSIRQNPEIIAAYTTAQHQGKRLHIMGLTSDGGVHSSLEHLFALLDIAKDYQLQGKTFVHCFMDGRDVPPSSGADYVRDLYALASVRCDVRLGPFDERGGRQQTIVDVHDQIKDLLRHEARGKAMDAYVAELREKATIQYKEAKHECTCGHHH